MTKYCSYFLKNIACPNIECVFLHKLANEKDCFLREKTIGGLFMVPNEEVVNFLIENYNKLRELKKNYINNNTILPNILEGIKEVENFAKKNNIKIDLKIEKNKEKTKKNNKNNKNNNLKKYWNEKENINKNINKIEDKEETRSSKNDSVKEKKINEKDNLNNYDQKIKNNNLSELDKMIWSKLNNESNILSLIIRKKFKIWRWK